MPHQEKRLMDTRIDYYPTHEYNGFRFRRGRPMPFGATIVPRRIEPCG